MIMRWMTPPRWVPICTFVLAAGCTGDSDPVSEPSWTDVPADYIALDVHTAITETGVLRARIHGDTAYTWEDTGRMLMFPLEVELFGEHGARTARLTADEGELDTNTNRMLARGNVVVITFPDERRLLTKEIHYDPRQGRIWSETSSVMYEGDTRIVGSGFRANEDMTDIELFESAGENLEIQF